MTKKGNYSKWNAIYQQRTNDSDVDYWMFETIKAHTNSSALILELACGRGALAMALASFGYKVKAVDFSQAALAQIPKIENLQLLRMDLTKEFPQGQFDVIFARYFFDALLLEKIYGALKTDGYLIVKTFDERILKEKPHFNTDWILSKRHFDENKWQLRWASCEKSVNSSALIAQKF